jgi:hypothetical protein
LIAATARGLSVTGDIPDGPPRHFCDPEYAASTPQPSISTATPPSDVTQSAISSAPWRSAIAPEPAHRLERARRGLGVDDGDRLRLRDRHGLLDLVGLEDGAHSFSSFVTVAPIRPASSAMRFPKYPALHTTSLSPGSSRLPRTASIPDMPVPDTASVALLSVRKTPRSSPVVSSIIWISAGSRWPSAGAARGRA